MITPMLVSTLVLSAAAAFLLFPPLRIKLGMTCLAWTVIIMLMT